MQKITVEEFQSDFDNLMNRVESGETFIITSEYGNAVIVPYNELVQIGQDTDTDVEDIVKIHTDHEEAS